MLNIKVGEPIGTLIFNEEHFENIRHLNVEVYKTHNKEQHYQVHIDFRNVQQIQTFEAVTGDEADFKMKEVVFNFLTTYFPLD